MSVAAVAMPRPFIVSLIGDGDGSPLFRTLLAPLMTDAIALPASARTPAERNLLAARIDRAVTSAPRDVMLVAEGAACQVAAWWARLSPAAYVSAIVGAVMVTPEGLHNEGFASPRARLPFPTIVLGEGDRAGALAGEWGGRLLAPPLGLGAQGPNGRLAQMIDRFTTAVVARDLRAAEVLMSLRDA